MVLTFLSDYGLDDDYVGVCHGVMATIAPDVRVIDLSHAIPRLDVRRGALVLARALAFTPPGVHVAVVDPGVGSARRAVAVRVADDDRVLVGPDNGLLWPATQRFGGVRAAVEISASRHRLQPVSATFHGRDLFAPVGAALAAGAPWHEAGEAIDGASLVALDLPGATVTPGRIDAHVLAVDHFGNIGLDVEHDTAGAVGADLRVNGTPAVHVHTFADTPRGALVLYRDSFGTLSLAVNQGSAAQQLDLTLDADVRIEWS
jgi:S-adenosyl-L-methionine hydrolase (adenosine-forming)